MNVDILSGEFVEFSAKAKALFDEKEALNLKFKEVYLNHKKQIEEIDERANALKAQFFGG